MAKEFEVSLVTPDQMVLQGRARYVELPAHDGQMGVAAGRAAMLVKLGIGKLRIEGESDEKMYVLDGGFAQMQGDKLTLISERAIDGAELSEATAQDAMSRAEALPKQSMEDVARRDHDMAVARAMASVAGK